uniref:Uncharacterized protein n=1 Tax=Anopheles coluzzii TaxID=1518534 RepID=A0A8W7Q1G5_ANOCL
MVVALSPPPPDDNVAPAAVVSVVTEDASARCFLQQLHVEVVILCYLALLALPYAEAYVTLETEPKRHHRIANAEISFKMIINIAVCPFAFGVATRSLSKPTAMLTNERRTVGKD